MHQLKSNQMQKWTTFSVILIDCNTVYLHRQEAWPHKFQNLWSTGFVWIFLDCKQALFCLKICENARLHISIIARVLTDFRAKETARSLRSLKTAIWKGRRFAKISLFVQIRWNILELLQWLLCPDETTHTNPSTTTLNYLRQTYKNMFGQIYLNSRKKVSALCSRQIQFWKQGSRLQKRRTRF